jgi:hypothetical protein
MLLACNHYSARRWRGVWEFASSTLPFIFLALNAALVRIPLQPPNLEQHAKRGAFLVHTFIPHRRTKKIRPPVLDFGTSEGAWRVETI